MYEQGFKSNVHWTVWQGEEAISLSAGGYEGLMIPGVGANIIELKDNNRGLDLLRTPIDAETFKARPVVYGIPILFPPNRIEYGVFNAAGREYRYPVNDRVNHNHIHGFLYKQKWQITRMEVTEDHKAVVEAVFINNKDTDFFVYLPHEFEFKVTYELSEEGLKQVVTVKNNSKEPMPMGLGYHTAFKVPFHGMGKAEDYRLYVSIGEQWKLNEWTLPVGQPVSIDRNGEKFINEGMQAQGHPVEGHYTSKPMALMREEFHGAALEDVSNKLMFIYETGKSYKHWVIWNQTGDNGFICPEPQTWAINAPNISLPEEVTGFRLLSPGEVFKDYCRMYVKEI